MGSLPRGLLALLDKEGYAIFENFLTPQECDEILKGYHALLDSTPPNNLMVASTHHWEKEKAAFAPMRDENRYFLESGDGVGFFQRDGALPLQQDATLEDKLKAVGRIGYGLHIHKPVFNKYTMTSKAKAIACGLGYKTPIIVSSQLITDAVAKHQDLTYLFVEPDFCLLNVWINLSGEVCSAGKCRLQVIPQSHKNGLVDGNRFIRTSPGPITNTINVDLGYTVSPNLLANVDDTEFVPVMVPKGAAVLIHGNTVYKTEKCKSRDAYRHNNTYCFHMAESDGVEWSRQNFLQPTHAPFLQLTGR